MELDRMKGQAGQAPAAFLPRLGKYKYALIVLLVGILLLYAGGGARDRPEDSPTPQDGAAQAFDLAAFQAELEEKLGKIAGIGRVELMLSLDETGEAVYASNVREAENGGESGSYESTLSTVSDGSYGEQPVRIKETCPTFRGAVVLCDGAGQSGVRLAVTDAVGAVCGLGADRISVIQMGQD